MGAWGNPVTREVVHNVRVSRPYGRSVCDRAAAVLSAGAAEAIGKPPASPAANKIQIHRNIVRERTALNGKLNPILRQRDTQSRTNTARRAFIRSGCHFNAKTPRRGGAKIFNRG